jgi:hypothetical protein
MAKHQSSRWQQIANIPAETFEEHIAGTKAQVVELTTAGALRLAKEHERMSAQARKTQRPGWRVVMLTVLSEPQQWRCLGVCWLR